MSQSRIREAETYLSEANKAFNYNHVEVSIDYYLKARAIYQELGDNERIVECYARLAGAYKLINKQLLFLNNVLEGLEVDGNSEEGTLYGIMIEFYLGLEFVDLRDYNHALQVLHETRSRIIDKEKNNEDDEFLNKYHLLVLISIIECYILLHQNEKAKVFLLEAKSKLEGNEKFHIYYKLMEAFYYLDCLEFAKIRENIDELVDYFLNVDRVIYRIMRCVYLLVRILHVIEEYDKATMILDHVEEIFMDGSSIFEETELAEFKVRHYRYIQDYDNYLKACEKYASLMIYYHENFPLSEADIMYLAWENRRYKHL